MKLVIIVDKAPEEAEVPDLKHGFLIAPDAHNGRWTSVTLDGKRLNLAGGVPISDSMPLYKDGNHAVIIRPDAMFVIPADLTAAAANQAHGGPSQENVPPQGNTPPGGMASAIVDTMTRGMPLSCAVHRTFGAEEQLSTTFLRHTPMPVPVFNFALSPELTYKLLQGVADQAKELWERGKSDE